jgi:hypothetical protein
MRVTRRAPDAAAMKDWVGLQIEPLSESSSMVSPCFQLPETRELTLRIEEEGRQAPETSHAGIIRIGF